MDYLKKHSSLMPSLYYRWSLNGKAREVKIRHGPFQIQILKSLSFENFEIAKYSKMKSKICICVVFLNKDTKWNWYLSGHKEISSEVCCRVQVIAECFGHCPNLYQNPSVRKQDCLPSLVLVRRLLTADPWLWSCNDLLTWIFQ